MVRVRSVFTSIRQAQGLRQFCLGGFYRGFRLIKSINQQVALADSVVKLLLRIFQQILGALAVAVGRVEILILIKFFLSIFQVLQKGVHILAGIVEVGAVLVRIQVIQRLLRVDQGLLCRARGRIRLGRDHPGGLV